MGIQYASSKHDARHQPMSPHHPHATVNQPCGLLSQPWVEPSASSSNQSLPLSSPATAQHSVLKARLAIITAAQGRHSLTTGSHSRCYCCPLSLQDAIAAAAADGWTAGGNGSSRCHKIAALPTALYSPTAELAAAPADSMRASASLAHCLWPLSLLRPCPKVHHQQYRPAHLQLVLGFECFVASCVVPVVVGVEDKVRLPTPAPHKANEKAKHLLAWWDLVWYIAILLNRHVHDRFAWSYCAAPGCCCCCSASKQHSAVFCGKLSAETQHSGLPECRLSCLLYAHDCCCILHSKPLSFMQCMCLAEPLMHARHASMCVVWVCVCVGGGARERGTYFSFRALLTGSTSDGSTTAVRLLLGSCRIHT